RAIVPAAEPTVRGGAGRLAAVRRARADGARRGAEAAGLDRGRLRGRLCAGALVRGAVPRARRPARLSVGRLDHGDGAVAAAIDIRYCAHLDRVAPLAPERGARRAMTPLEAEIRRIIAI